MLVYFFIQSFYFAVLFFLHFCVRDDKNRFHLSHLPFQKGSQSPSLANGFAHVLNQFDFLIALAISYIASSLVKWSRVVSFLQATFLIELLDLSCRGAYRAVGLPYEI